MLLNKDAFQYIKTEYPKRTKLKEIAKTLNGLGYTQERGSPINTATVSCIAHKQLGLPRRINKIFKHKNGASGGTFNTESEIIVVAKSNLPDSLKVKFLRKLIKEFEK